MMAVDIVENLRIKTRERGRVHAENEDGDERVIHFDLEKVKGMQEGKVCQPDPDGAQLCRSCPS